MFNLHLLYLVAFLIGLLFFLLGTKKRSRFQRADKYLPIWRAAPGRGLLVSGMVIMVLTIIISFVV